MKRPNPNLISPLSDRLRGWANGNTAQTVATSHPYISGSGFIPSTLKKQMEEAGLEIISPLSDRLRK
jgi:hypothetical protein